MNQALIPRYFLMLLFMVAAYGCARHVAPVSEIDGPPAHVSPRLQRMQEPTPKEEPNSTYGNHSPYRVNGKSYRVLASARGYKQKGIASWYGKKFHGRKTSSGEVFDMYAFTAAHKSLPLPTYARVTNLANGRSIVVKINDRGPFRKNRLLDLSFGAATRLDMIEKGTGLVEIEALSGQKTELPAPDDVHRSGKIFIQAGAFASHSNARSLQMEIELAGLESPHIDPIEKNGTILYRVRIGPLQSVREADRLIDRLNGIGLGESSVVVE